MGIDSEINTETSVVKINKLNEWGRDYHFGALARTFLEPLYTLRLAFSVPKEERDTLDSRVGVSYKDVTNACIVFETIKLGAYVVLASGLSQMLR